MELIKIATLLITVFIVTLTKHVFSLNLNDGVKRLINAQADSNDNIRYEAYLKIYTNPPSHCTGAIIGEKFILTAAHCVVVPNTHKIIHAKIEVRTAVTKLVGENHVVGLVEKVYVPSMYHNFFNNPFHSLGDIAVLKLTCKLGLEIDYKFQKLSLPYEETNNNNIDQHAGKSYQFSGFGAVQATPRWSIEYGKYVFDKTYSSQLHYATAKVFSYRFCKVKNGYYQLCATLIDTGLPRGVCSGDSGGALIDPVQLTVVGIANWGRIDCIEDRNHPTVYTRVSSFLDFIHKAQADKGYYRDVRGFNSEIRTQNYNFEYQYPIPNDRGGICQLHKISI